MFQQDRAGKSDNFADPAKRIGGRSGKGNRKGPKNFRNGQNSPRNREGQKQRRRPKTSQKGQKGQKGQRSRKGRKIQFESKNNNNLEILEETNLGKVVENLQGEVKRFNKEVEKIRLECQKPEKFKERIKEGRVLPPLLRSLQLLLQR
jgi:hypothetical protein